MITAPLQEFLGAGQKGDLPFFKVTSAGTSQKSMQ